MPFFRLGSARKCTGKSSSAIVARIVGGALETRAWSGAPFLDPAWRNAHAAGGDDGDIDVQTASPVHLTGLHMKKASA